MYQQTYITRPREVVERYFAFTHFGSPRIQVLFKEHREEIYCQLLPWDSCAKFRRDDLATLFSPDRDLATIWVRQGFALTILYLHHFGHVPPLPQD